MTRDAKYRIRASGIRRSVAIGLIQPRQFIGKTRAAFPVVCFIRFADSMLVEYPEEIVTLGSSQ